MTERPRKFKTIKHYHEPGDLHELTFSCYRRITLLTNNPWREALSRSIDEVFQLRDAATLPWFKQTLFVFRRAG